MSADVVTLRKDRPSMAGRAFRIVLGDADLKLLKTEAQRMDNINLDDAAGRILRHALRLRDAQGGGG
jgi:hypothetical protein